MNITIGHPVSVFHYSSLHPFRSTVVDSKDDTVTLKLTKEFASMYFLEDDPAVLVYTSTEGINIFGCMVVCIDSRKAVVEVRIDHIGYMGEEKRRYERFPVSLYADIKAKNTSSKITAIVKDISLFGMRAFSKYEFYLGQVFEMELYINEKVIFLQCEIMRKTPNVKFFEYGLRIVYTNTETLSFIKTFLKMLKEEKEKYMRY